MICDGERKRWVKDALKDSKSADSIQKEIYDLHKKGEIVNKREFKADVDLDELMNTSLPSDTDPNDCISFIAIDRYMNQVKENPEIYIALFEKKHNLLTEVD